PDPVTTGSNLTYSVRVHNNGPDSAAVVTLSDALPDGVVFVSASPGCTNIGGTVTCTISNLAKAANSTATIIVTVTNAPGQICNTASVESTETDPLFDNNAATACTEVTAAPETVHDMAITKISAPATVVLSARKPTVTRFVKVQIQNRSPHPEMITSNILP